MNADLDQHLIFEFIIVSTIYDNPANQVLAAPPDRCSLS
jgi:hypothetical protein